MQMQREALGTYKGALGASECMGASKYTGGVHMPPRCKTYMPLKKIKAKFLHLKTYKGVFENMGTSEASGGVQMHGGIQT